MDAAEQRMAALERRVEQLEAVVALPQSQQQGASGKGQAAHRVTADLVDRLHRSSGGGVGDGDGDGDTHPKTSDAAPTGTIAYAGSVESDGREYVWVKERTVAEILESDWTEAAKRLERLGSPARLALLTTLLSAPRSRAQLQEALGDTSTGHLYHHLRELQAAGLVQQHRRGEYELVPHALVPLLAVVAAALDLGADSVPSPSAAGS